MNCTGLSQDAILDRLKDSGCRITAPRKALVASLAESHTPQSVIELHAAANKRIGTPTDPEPVNLVTAYRFVNLLETHGLARRIDFAQGYARYEPTHPDDAHHHHHIVCDNCGKVEPFDDCDVDELSARIEARSGFVVMRHQLELYGKCAECTGQPETA